MRRVREYRYIVREMMQADLERHDGIDELAFFALVLWLQQRQSADELLAYLDEGPWDGTVRTYLKGIFSRYSSILFEAAESLRENDVADILASLPFYRSLSVTETPAGVTALAGRLLQLQEGDKLADLCSGLGDFALASCKAFPEITCTAIEKDKKSYVGAVLRTVLAGLPITHICGDVLEPATIARGKEPNKIFTRVPLRPRYRDLADQVRNYPALSSFFFGEKRSISAEWVFAVVAAMRHAPSGRAVVMMPGKGLYNNVDREVRQEFLRRGWIEGVIALPERLLGNSAIGFYLLVLSENNESVRMVDGTSFFKAERRQNVLTDQHIESILSCYDTDTEQSCRLSMAQLAANGYVLEPQRYLTKTDPRLEKGWTVDDVCTVSRGFVTGAGLLDELVNPEPTPYRYLMVQDLDNGRIRADLPYLKALPQRGESACLQKGDILLSKMAPFKTALADDVQDEQVLVTGNVYILRCHEDAIEPAYLMLYLQSALGLSELNYWAKGSHIQNIAIGDLRKVRIPILSKEKQQAMAQQYQKLSEAMKEAEERLSAIRQKMSGLLDDA